MHAARQVLGVGIAAHVVVAGHTRDPAEHRLVRPPRSPEHVDDRQGRRRSRCRGARRAGRHRGTRPSPAELGAACRQSRTVAGMSASDSDAAMTTAASVGWGRLRSRPGTNSSIRVIASAPTSPVSWVLAPACSATAVREPLVLTGKPWKSPAAMLAAPMPIISWSPSTSWPAAGGERRRGRDRVGERDERDAERAADQQRQVGERHVRHGERWEALGQRTDQRDAVVGQVEGDGGEDRDDHGDEHGRNLGKQPLEHEDEDQAEQADCERGRHRLAVGQPLGEAARLGMKPSASTEKPNSLGSWPTRIVRARPFM